MTHDVRRLKWVTDESVVTHHAKISPTVVLITCYFSNSAKFRRNDKIPQQRANSTARLESPRKTVGPVNYADLLLRNYSLTHSRGARVSICWQWSHKCRQAASTVNVADNDTSPDSKADSVGRRLPMIILVSHCIVLLFVPQGQIPRVVSLYQSMNSYDEWFRFSLVIYYCVICIFIFVIMKPLQ